MNNLDDFIGKPWDDYFEQNDISSDCDIYKSNTHISKLDFQDLIHYGHVTSSWNQDFYLVVCEICSRVLLPQAFIRHFRKRHKNLDTGAVGDGEVRSSNLLGDNFCHKTSWNNPSIQTPTYPSSDKASKAKDGAASGGRRRKSAKAAASSGPAKRRDQQLKLSLKDDSRTKNNTSTTVNKNINDPSSSFHLNIQSVESRKALSLNVTFPITETWLGTKKTPEESLSTPKPDDQGGISGGCQKMPSLKIVLRKVTPTPPLHSPSSPVNVRASLAHTPPHPAFGGQTRASHRSLLTSAFEAASCPPINSSEHDDVLFGVSILSSGIESTNVLTHGSLSSRDATGAEPRDSDKGHICGSSTAKWRYERLIEDEEVPLALLLSRRPNTQTVPPTQVTEEEQSKKRRKKGKRATERIMELERVRINLEQRIRKLESDLRSTPYADQYEALLPPDPVLVSSTSSKTCNSAIEIVVEGGGANSTDNTPPHTNSSNIESADNRDVANETTMGALSETPGSPQMGNTALDDHYTDISYHRSQRFSGKYCRPASFDDTPSTCTDGDTLACHHPSPLTSLSGGGGNAGRHSPLIPTTAHYHVTRRVPVLNTPTVIDAAYYTAATQRRLQSLTYDLSSPQILPSAPLIRPTGTLSSDLTPHAANIIASLGVIEDQEGPSHYPRSLTPSILSSTTTPSSPYDSSLDCGASCDSRDSFGSTPSGPYLQHQPRPPPHLRRYSNLVGGSPHPERHIPTDVARFAPYQHSYSGTGTPYPSRNGLRGASGSPTPSSSTYGWEDLNRALKSATCRTNLQIRDQRYTASNRNSRGNLSSENKCDSTPDQSPPVVIADGANDSPIYPPYLSNSLSCRTDNANTSPGLPYYPHIYSNPHHRSSTSRSHRSHRGAHGFEPGTEHHHKRQKTLQDISLFQKILELNSLTGGPRQSPLLENEGPCFSTMMGNHHPSMGFSALSSPTYKT